MQVPHAVKMIKRFVYCRVELALLSADLTGRTPKPLPSAVQLRAIEIGDHATLANIVGIPGYPQDLSERLAASRGLMLLKDNQPLGYYWGATQVRKAEGIPPLAFDVVPKARHYYFYDLFVSPAQRSFFAALALMQGMVNQALADGAEQAFFLTAHPAVEKISQGLGFRQIGKVSYRRILGCVTKNLTALDLVCKTGR